MLRSAPISALLLALAASSAAAQEAADRIWRGGAVLTMEDAAPRAEALAAKEGRILAVGPEAAVMAHRGPETEVIDLGGRALLPGFFDAHGHVMMGGLQALSANLLAPPDGGVADLASLQATLRAWMAENAEAVARFGLVIGFGYDNASLAERRHPTREDLDAVSTEHAIYLVHQSGHFGSANSKALELAGITAETPDPPGGLIRRGPDGRPDGVLEETAHFPAIAGLLFRVGPEGMEAMARAGARLWARYGYTTAEEGRSIPDTAALMAKVAAEGGFAIDVLTYPDVLVDRDWIAANVSGDYVNRFRVAGAKLTIDGSPQGFTAWRDRPYVDPVGDYPPAYAGYPAASVPQVTEAVDWAYATGVQIITHANGEAASDLLLAAHRAAQAGRGAEGRRDVLIHGQFLREDQVDAMKALGLTASLFPMHTFYWGDWHREHTVGPVLADDISPTGWMTARGMRFSSHHDAPVAFPDSMRVLDATVTRRSRSGDILGAHHRVDVTTALKAMTLWPAWHHFEDDRKGSLAPGKLADLVILSEDPTAVDPETLDRLRVLATIKEGETVFDAAADRGSLGIGPGPAGDAFGRAMREAGLAFALAGPDGTSPLGVRAALREAALRASPHAVKHAGDWAARALEAGAARR
jgi:predicted amidohydrolase YtcJ